jgi:hypothetical protein
MEAQLRSLKRRHRYIKEFQRDINNKTRTQLCEFIKKFKVKGYSRASKQELIDFINCQLPKGRTFKKNSILYIKS